MPLPPNESIARARAQLGTYDINRKGMCLKVSRSWPQVSALYADASTGWRNTDYRHPGDKNAPVGAMFWWTGGPDGFGHVAISDGGGFCISTDWKDGYRAGWLNRAHVDEISRRWGLPFQGWSEDINEVRIWTPGTPVNGGSPTKEEEVIPADQWRHLTVALQQILDKTNPIGAIANRAVNIEAAVSRLDDRYFPELKAGIEKAIKASGSGSGQLDDADRQRIDALLKELKLLGPDRS